MQGRLTTVFVHVSEKTGGLGIMGLALLLSQNEVVSSQACQGLTPSLRANGGVASAISTKR